MVSEDIIDEEIRLMHGNDDRSSSINSSIFKMPIKELKVIAPVIVSEDTTLSKAIALMQEAKVGCVIMTSNDGILSGILTERDLLNKVLGKLDNYREIPVSKVMTKKPLSLRMEDRIAHVMHNMHMGSYRYIPIVDQDKKPIGVVSLRLVNSFILGFFPKDIYNITDVPFRGVSQRDDA